MLDLNIINSQIKFSGSQTLACIKITWKAWLLKPDCWERPLPIPAECLIM